MLSARTTHPINNLKPVTLPIKANYNISFNKTLVILKASDISPPFLLFLFFGRAKKRNAGKPARRASLAGLPAPAFQISQATFNG
ncbi:hypothetical protein DSL64_02995 [Dyadobacter luteus]|uniref:Uncharacterized protein n=1 Tax=Dyadobacter luteus TaxID=2259619 RepID=A0A3D8YIJ0_9BACT|nr:hypothetical protein DSL64_02995 [Dyadobacter luteus]